MDPKGLIEKNESFNLHEFQAGVPNSLVLPQEAQTKKRRPKFVEVEQQPGNEMVERPRKALVF